MKGLTKRVESILAKLKEGDNGVAIKISFTIDGKKREYRFYGNNLNVIIGRSNECDVVIEHSSVSRTHARLWMEEGVIWLEDLKSKNGTYIGDKKIEGKHNVSNEITVGWVKVKIDLLMNYEKNNVIMEVNKKYVPFSLITGIILIIAGIGIILFVLFHSLL